MEEETFGDFNDSMYDSQNESMESMSDMVHSMASQIYAEFERLIGAYGDGVVEGLMPQLVGILENWDKVLKEKQAVQLELDLTKEDNDQLLEQYEREKQLRKAADQRNMEVEDIIEEQKKDLQSKLEVAQKSSKVLEIKARSCQDQVNRLEEKESLVKADYDKLHGRYTELFKSHMEMMERTKAMMSSDKSETDSSNIAERIQSKNSSKPAAGGNFVAPPTPEGDAPQFIDDQPPLVPVITTPSADNSQRDFSLQSEITSERSGSNLALSLEAAAFDELDPELDNMAGSMVNPGDFASGMTKEVENLIKENQELIQTKNALNVVKDDLIAQVDELTGSLELLRAELQAVKHQKETVNEKVAGLEEEVKQLNAKQQAAENNDNEEDIPRAQRKRFTRVEMARVLMERNQYKERLMELQEAVRWTEMIRASKETPDSGPKKKSGIWSLFSNLFAGNSKTKKLPSAAIHYNAPATHLQPVGDPNKPRRLQEMSGGDKAHAYDFLQEDAVMKTKNELLGMSDRLSDQGRRQREADRRDKYRQVQAYVTKDDGRVQAYGWSVPTGAADQRALMSVPVPVYCRPLISAEDEQTALWCAAAVYRSAGRTKDGGSIVGAHSMFYSDTVETSAGAGGGDAEDESLLSTSAPIAELNQQLKNHQRALSESTDITKLTSLVWLCTTTRNHSKVQVINAGNPAEVLESFQVPDAHILTIASIPGISEQDYPAESDSHDCVLNKEQTAEGDEDNDKITVKFVDSSSSTSLTSTSDKYESFSDKLPDGNDESEDTSSRHSIDDSKRKLMLPTMWIGLQNGILMIHSSMDEWVKPVRCLNLGDCILCIVHSAGKVFIGLANGTLAVFHRNADGAWCFDDYHVIDFGEEKVPIRAIANVANSSLWIGHRNKIYTLNVQTLVVTKAFEAHSCKDSQVRLMTWSGDGVWVAIRNDTTLRLYHAFTLKHLQDLNIQPCVEKLIVEDKHGLSRVTSLELSCSRLWIGTGNGIIISLPLTLENQQDASKAVDIPSKDKPPGGAVRVYSDTQGDQVTPASYVPYCDLSQAQLSYHGHRDCVRFFSTIAGNSKETSLVMSGGEGYVDFRVGDEEPEVDEQSPAFWSHLIVWEVSNQLC